MSWHTQIIKASESDPGARRKGMRTTTLFSISSHKSGFLWKTLKKRGRPIFVQGSKNAQSSKTKKMSKSRSPRRTDPCPPWAFSTSPLRIFLHQVENFSSSVISLVIFTLFTFTPIPIVSYTQNIFPICYLLPSVFSRMLLFPTRGTTKPYKIHF